MPQVIAVCDDASVIGVPFYLMECAEGTEITDVLPTELSALGQRAAITNQAVDARAHLHLIGVPSGKLANVGSPNGYLLRQIRLFRSLWCVNTRRDLPAVEAPARVTAIFDWEMATLGDPLDTTTLCW